MGTESIGLIAQGDCVRRIEFTIPGVPVAKGRPRITTRGKYARAYTPAKTREAEQTLAARAMAFRPKRPLECPLHIDVTFWMPIPASWSRKKQESTPPHTTKPDLDNLVKLLKDSLNGVFWLDDKQIWSMYAVKRYATVPATSISIHPTDTKEQSPMTTGKG